MQDAVLTDELRAYLAENRIETRPYESFYDYAAAIPAGETVLLDKRVCNYRLVSELCEGVEIVDETNPSVLMKSIKNQTEQKNTVNAHIKDGVAVTKFIYWLKKNIGKTPMTELSASDYLAARRMDGDGSLRRGVDGARIFLAVNELNFDEHADKDKYEREQYAGQGNAPYRKSL